MPEFLWKDKDTDMIRVVGISGKAGVGKDFVAKWLANQLPNSMIVAFADQLKINAMIQHSLSFEEVFEKKTNATRKLLQQTGTEQGRNIHGDDIWLRYMKIWITLHNQRMGVRTFIITDCRFQNEVEFVKQFTNHVTIRVIAPNRHAKRLAEENSQSDTTITNHSSECDLDKSENLFDSCIYNDSEDDVFKQLYMMLPTFHQKLLYNKIEK